MKFVFSHWLISVWILLVNAISDKCVLSILPYFQMLFSFFCGLMLCILHNSKLRWWYSRRKIQKFLHWQARMPAAPPRGLARSPYMQSETTKRWVGEKRAGGVLLPAEWFVWTPPRARELDANRPNPLIPFLPPHLFLSTLPLLLAKSKLYTYTRHQTAPTKWGDRPLP